MGLGLGLGLGLARRRCAAPVAAWHPTDLAVVSHMWDMHDSPRYSDAGATTPIPSGDQVCGAFACLKTGELFSQGTTGLKGTITRAVQNGRDILRLDAVDDGYASSVAPAVPYELLVIERCTGSGALLRTIQDATVNSLISARRTSYACTVAGTLVSAYQAGLGCRLLRLKAVSGNCIYLVDEVDQTTAARAVANWGTGLTVGAVGYSSQAADTDLCAILHCDAGLTTGEAAQIWAWAQSTWGAGS